MTPDRPFGRFFLPGPTEVRPEILEAMLGPMIGHRTPGMEALMRRIQPGARALFGTERPVYVAAASGTGMMEMAVTSTARRRVLSLVNGAFSERFAEVAHQAGFEVDRLTVDWGENHTPALLGDALGSGDYDTVTICHSETSTGVLNPVADLTTTAHDAGALVCVDTVSSLGGAPFQTDEWGTDFVVTASQKAMAMPPGLGFGVAQPSVLERSDGAPGRSYYFDIHRFEKNLEKDQTPNTPAISLMYAAAAQMEAVLAEGVEARWTRHRDMAERTYAWVDEMHGLGFDLRVFAPAGHRSPTVTCITLPDDLRGSEITDDMEARGFTIAPGYGRLKDGMIRIGHMGDHTLDELDAVLDALAEVLERARSGHG